MYRDGDDAPEGRGRMSRWSGLSETAVRRAVIVAERTDTTLSEAIAHYKQIAREDH